LEKLAVVIPAFNEERTIRDIANRASAYCDLLIVVDDGSTDKTSEVLEGLDLVVLKNSENLGKAASMWKGFQFALSEGCGSIVTLDADGQHRPEDIPKFIELSKARPDTIVIGSRLHERQNIPKKRYYANRFANFWISWAAGYPIPDSQSGFRLYPSKLLNALDLDLGREKSFVFESEVLIEGAWQGVESVSLPIPAIYDDSLRKSHFRSVADINLITKMVAARLLQRRMHIRGLYRATIHPRVRKYVVRGMDHDAGMMLLLSSLIFIATGGMIYLWQLLRVVITAFFAKTTVDEKPEVILVPGKRLENGTLSNEYRERLMRVVELGKITPFPEIYILGGSTDGGATEAEVGREFLITQSVPESKINLEEKSTNTLENFRNIKNKMTNSGKSILVVSSRYHLERIATITKGLGIKAALCASESNRNLLNIVFHAFSEAFYLHWYWVGRLYGSLTKNKRILEKLT